VTRPFAFVLLAASVPSALVALPTGGPIGHSGVPSGLPFEGNGQTCQRCHNAFPLNSPGGSVRIRTFHYKPGQPQTVQVTVSHPSAVKWGFQLTARMATDLSKRVGTFSLGNVLVRCSDRTVNNVLGRPVTAEDPCPPEALEFAGHNADIVFGGENGAKTFEVEWTPPENDVGNVVFYAVGNAANNATGNQGDRIYSDNLEIEAAGRTCTNTIRPTLQSAGNAASFTRDVSMNTLVTIYGMNFASSGTKRTAGRADLRDGFPKELGCVAVEIGNQRVPVTYVSPDQINAQIPTITTTGQVPMRVVLNPDRPNELRSDVGTITLLNYSPAFFTFGSNGKNVAAVHQDGTYATDPAVVQGSRAVRAGDIVQLYATGLGPTNPTWQAGEMPTAIAELRDRLTVTIGGTTLAAADVLYAGLAPGAISGLYQINVRFPAVADPGDVPVRLSIGGVTSPAGTVLTAGR
jgi:uncharacterized protein (TIGR03437 family)